MIVEARPDELCLSHAGRCCWIFGEEKFDELRGLKGERSPRERHLSFDVLAKFAGVDVHQYVARHSMLPLLKPIAVSFSKYGHGGERVKPTAPGTLPVRSLRYCTACLADDLAVAGHSWFRRSHHLQGIEWCPKHGSVLMEVSMSVRAANMRTPCYWHDVGKGSKIAEPVELMALQANEFILRVLAINLALLERSRPLLNRVVNARLKRLAYREVDRYAQASWHIAQKMRRLAPERWLFPHRSALHSIEDVPSNPNTTLYASSVLHWALLPLYVAAVTSNVQEALDVLNREPSKDELRSGAFDFQQSKAQAIEAHQDSNLDGENAEPDLQDESVVV